MNTMVERTLHEATAISSSPTVDRPTSRARVLVGRGAGAVAQPHCGGVREPGSVKRGSHSPSIRGRDRVGVPALAGGRRSVARTARGLDTDCLRDRVVANLRAHRGAGGASVGRTEADEVLPLSSWSRADRDLCGSTTAGVPEGAAVHRGSSRAGAVDREAGDQGPRTCDRSVSAVGGVVAREPTASEVGVAS